MMSAGYDDPYRQPDEYQPPPSYVPAAPAAPEPTAPPSAPAPTAPAATSPSAPLPTAPTLNQYGNYANLDPTYQRTFYENGLTEAGVSRDDPRWQQIPYYIGKSSNLDTFSDGTEHVGANNYWLKKLITQSDSADPSLAGTVGLVSRRSVSSPSAPTFSAPQSSAFQDQIRQMLMQQMQSASRPIDVNSDEIKQPYDAARLSASRDLDEEQKALAERLYAEGGGSGSNELQQGIQQSRERSAVGLAGIRGQLVQRAVQMRQQQLQQALQLAVQSGDADAARAVQMQLAQLDNAFRYASLGQQASQFGQQLGQQRSQWADSFGLQAGQFQYLKDRDLANAGLGG